MQSWLLVAAAMHAAPANLGIHAKSLAPAVIGHMAGHTVDLRLSDSMQSQGSMFREIDLEREIGPGAQVGVGMGGSSDGAKGAFRLPEKSQPRHSGGPAINFVLKF